MIVVTAGHVDHGKSTLVRLLTDVDPDRWDEERRRGLTIDLGFAWTTLASGSQLGFVDVPGHERFLRNMLAGCGAIDLALLVVSAREGWKPQTEEHLQILDLLGVRRGLVALTHTDVVDGATTDVVEAEVRDRLHGTFLAGARVVRTAVNDGATVERLRDALDDATPTTTPIGATSRPRLWIDRSFTLPGAGRIVTGTLAGGTLALGDPVVVSDGAGDRPARIRGIRRFGAPAPSAEPGTRVALGLAGIKRAPERGAAVVAADSWRRGSHLHVAMRTVRGLLDPPRARGAYTMFVGTLHVPVHVAYPARTDDAGDTPDVVARLRADRAVGPLSIGDRFVLRDEGRATTVAGGVIVAIDDRSTRYRPADLAARLAAVRAATPAVREERLAEQLLRERGGTAEAAALGRELGSAQPAGTVRLGDRVVLVGTAELLSHERSRRLDEAVRELDAAAERVRGVLDAVDPPLVPIISLTASGTADRPTVRRLVERGDLVGVGAYVTTAPAFDGFVRGVRSQLDRSPATLAELRSALGMPRKEAVALLETMDERGITRRVDGRRVLRDPAGDDAARARRGSMAEAKGNRTPRT